MAVNTNGSLTGWLAYTLSKSTRQFNELNNGKPFPYSFDRRHQLKIFSNLILGSVSRGEKTINRNFSGSFNFSSGNYITLATQTYQGLPLPLTGKTPQTFSWFYQRELIENVNNYQLPQFHHLNLSYQVERVTNDKTIIWNFSVYNVYNRLNPWYYYKKGNQLKQISMFPIIPSISYTYRW